MTTKICSKCQQEKPLSEFWVLAHSKDGKRPDCKQCYKIPAQRMPVADRFWDKVKKGSESECWLWIAGDNGEGYGRFRHGRKKVAAHRFSWELVHGPINDESFVLHKCDNPACVNPAHLFLGTNQDNMIDMVLKGRNKPRLGKRNNKAKLTEDAVREIRRIYASGSVSQYQLAEKYGVGQPCIKDVVNFITWRHVR